MIIICYLVELQGDQQHVIKPSKRMCQPHKVIRRTLTVPPLTNPSNTVDLHTEDVKNLKSNNDVVLDAEKDVDNKSVNNVSNRTHTVTINDTKTYDGGTELQRKKVAWSLNSLSINRRKSYESLDVIDGRTLTPVSTTARQRLLKVDT